MADTAAERLELSMVIPAFNEARRLPESLARVMAYLAAKPFASEVIVVDDGSADDTADVVRVAAARWPSLRLIESAHRGKGGAVRLGILAARGAYVAFADADLSMPVAEFDRFTPQALGPFDLAIGSREAPGAVRYAEPQYRHLMGRVFNALVRLLLLPGIQDTQCGFKCLSRGVALDLARSQTIEDFGFDVELLYIASLRGYRVVEVPIPWYYVPGSRVSPVRDTITMVRDLFRIRANARRGVYRPLAAPAAGDVPSITEAPAPLPASAPKS
ncbi:MAG: dolichyl-phosphate beta-glucosyltransferase [Ktedonobacterales bacterium]